MTNVRADIPVICSKWNERVSSPKRLILHLLVHCCILLGTNFAYYLSILRINCTILCIFVCVLVLLLHMTGFPDDSLKQIIPAKHGKSDTGFTARK